MLWGFNLNNIQTLFIGASLAFWFTYYVLDFAGAETAAWITTVAWVGFGVLSLRFRTTTDSTEV